MQKRLLDLLLALIGLIFLCPVLLVIAVLVRIKLGSPVLFRQKRTGFQGSIFTMIKFRTMTDDCDAEGQLLPDEVRLTSFGKFLRKTSLDELPALWHVLVGEMSFVGPRPLLPEYLSLYTTFENRRHEALPGITGWAQVNGRNNITWSKKFELDVWYVEHRNLWLDLKILLMTVGKVVRASDISTDNYATAPFFQGHRVAVVGGGGHAKVVIGTLQASGYEIEGIYDDSPHLQDTEILRVPVKGPVSLLKTRPGIRGIIAIGDNHVRAALAASLPCEWITLIHPKAYVHESVVLGAGTIVMVGAVLQPGSHIGGHVIVNTGATVDHDCTVGDFTHIGPGCHLAGHVTIGQNVFCGVGSAVIPHITLGDCSTLGAASVAVGDIPTGVVAAGVPAKPLAGQSLRKTS